MKVAMLLDHPFYDSRVFMEAKALAENACDVTLYMIKDNEQPEVEIVDGFKVHRVFEPAINDVKAESYIRKMASVIARETYDVIHCHDQSMLHVGALVKQLNPKITLVYDSHELFHLWPMNISQTNRRWLWIKSYAVRRYQVFRERSHRGKIDYLITVNKSLAVILQKYLQVTTKPVILRNIPELQPLVRNCNVVRKEFDIDPGDKILVFIGANIYRHSLNIEAVIDQVGNAAGISLVFICGESTDKREISEYVKSKHYRNIYFHNFIPPSEIQTYLASCDVGLVPTWNKKDLSYWYALDNKLFEYLMAGIPILTTQQPEYRSIVEGSNIGICVNPDEPDAYINGFRQILENYDMYATNAEKARLILNWGHEKQALLDLYCVIQETRVGPQRV